MFLQKEKINLEEPISINFNVEDIPSYIDCGFMNDEVYVDYIERIFGTKLKADVDIKLKWIQSDNDNNILILNIHKLFILPIIWL